MLLVAVVAPYCACNDATRDAAACGWSAVYTDGRLYSATAADWSSRDSLIYSRPLRTEQHNSHWLNGTQLAVGRS